MKAIGHLDGEGTARGNSVALLVDRFADCAPGLKHLKRESRVLDRYYRATRYPSASTGPAPFAAFSRQQAVAAIEAASRFLRRAGAYFGETGSSPRHGRRTPMTS